LLRSTALALLASGALAVATGCATLGAALAPQEPPAGSESARRLADGPHRVVRLELRLVDATRATPANRGAPGAATRTLATSVWAPESAPGPVPLVVYSHGFLSTRSEATPLAEHLASHGYLVVAPDFPLSSAGAPGGPTLRDVASQPGDLRFLVDRLLDPPHDAGLPVRADPARIAAVGLSLGGLTTTLAAFHPGLRDPRLRAAVSIAGPGSLFAPRFFGAGEVPFLMIAGTQDLIVDYAANAPPILERAPHAALLTLSGGSHVGFAGALPFFVALWRHPDTLGCRLLRRRLPDDLADGNPFARLGGAEQGILPDAGGPLPCARDPVGLAMRPRRQQILLRLAVRAFLDAELGATPEARRAAWAYLATVLPGEAPEASLATRGIAPP
jgi:predicted dienelactone hydrolase